ncbi:MAG: uroporphyrinogen-III synthase [Truepera sp.]|nr:uroporphyrinogen-III synthase [Truepera sp.]
MKVVLTQSVGRLVGLEQALTARGYEVVRSPLIRTEPLLSAAVRERAAALLACPWLLFTSPAGVEAWRALALPLHGAMPRLGAVGAKTAKVIEGYGGEVKLIGQPATAEGLAEAFLESPLAAAPVGLPRGDRALPTLPVLLEKMGFAVRPVVVYRTRLLPWAASEVQAVILASPSAVEALPEEVGVSATLIAIGPSTGAAIRELGWPYVQAARPEVTAVLAALEGVHG